jgi:hypothetical protein
MSVYFGDEASFGRVGTVNLQLYLGATSCRSEGRDDDLDSRLATVPLTDIGHTHIDKALQSNVAMTHTPLIANLAEFQEVRTSK